MTVVGVHASHEQIHPTALLQSVQHAEAAGFTAAMSSDHFSPWSERQGHSGFAWSWLGAAMRACVLISSDAARHAAWLHDLIEIGIDEGYLHHVGQELAEFIDVFGEHVLPQLEVSLP